MIADLPRVLVEIESEGENHADRLTRLENILLRPITWALGRRVTKVNGLAIVQDNRLPIIMRIAAAVFALFFLLPFTAIGVTSRLCSKFHKRDYLVIRAQEYLQQGKTDWAFADLIQALKIQKNYSFARATLGAVYRQQGLDEKMVETTQAVLDTDSENVLALTTWAFHRANSGDEEQAENAINKALALAPEDPYVLTVLAVIQASQGKQDEVMTTLDEVLERAPSFPLPYVVQAACHLQEKKFSKASDALKKLIEIAPDLPNVRELKDALVVQYANQCFVRINNKRTDELTTEIRDWVRTDQSDTYDLIYQMLGYVLHDQEEDAEDLFETVKELDPDNSFALAVQALNYYKQWKRSAEEKTMRKMGTLVERALEITPKNAVAHYLQAKISQKNSDFTKALSYVEKALNVLSEDPVLIKLQESIEEKIDPQNETVQTLSFQSPMKIIRSNRGIR